MSPNRFSRVGPETTIRNQDVTGVMSSALSDKLTPSGVAEKTPWPGHSICGCFHHHPRSWLTAVVASVTQLQLVLGHWFFPGGGPHNCPAINSCSNGKQTRPDLLSPLQFMAKWSLLLLYFSCLDNSSLSACEVKTALGPIDSAGGIAAVWPGITTECT